MLGLLKRYSGEISVSHWTTLPAFGFIAEEVRVHFFRVTITKTIGF